MAPVSKRDALLEKARRKQFLDAAAETIKAIRKELFAEQLEIIDDPSENKGILGTRRAGKTETWPRYMVMTALMNPGCIVRVWAASRARCKELVWLKTLDVCNRNLVEHEAHGTDLRITFENRSEIRFVGADKDKEAQKKRGDGTVLEIVLESQSFGPFLEKLVEDIVEPSLFAARASVTLRMKSGGKRPEQGGEIGTVCLEGTPGPVCTGYWYWVTGDDGSEKKKRWASVGRKLKYDEETEETKGLGWSCHRIHVRNNPFVPGALEELARTMIRKGWNVKNPTYQREWCAVWVTDHDALYYKWNSTRNSYEISDEFHPWGKGWSHVLGWDVGFNDAMALVVWGWHKNDHVLYECASWSENHVTAQPVVDKIREFQARFNIIKMVADTGGGGKVFVEEVQNRHSLVFAPAQKSDKFGHVTLMNDDFITSRIKTLTGSELSRDLGGLIKDRDWDPTSGKPPESDPSAHEFSHTTDAALYAWRYAHSFLATLAPPVRPKEGTEEYMKLIEKEYDERMAKPVAKQEFWEADPDYEANQEWHDD